MKDKRFKKGSLKSFIINLTSKLILISLLTTNLILPSSAQAAGASLFLSPSSGTQNTGDKFTVRIYVSTSQSTNTYEVFLSVSNLTVTGLSTGGSICNLFPSPPHYDPTSAHFQCGLPTPGYTGSGGYIGAITVKGNAPGVAKINIDASSRVLANDGAGTNILASRGSASFTIQPPPTAAPQISSSTHPNQDAWYKNKNVSLSWTGPGDSFSYLLDQNSGTTPDQASEGPGKSKTYENLADGTWYFHVITKGSGGWSGASHYRIQIDSTAPLDFSPQADPKTQAETRPIIAFVTTDATSGIDHYEIKIDSGSFSKVDNPYKIPAITSGKHTAFVKAVDRAGNEKIGSVDFTIKQIPAPKIQVPSPGAIIPFGNDLLIQGQSFPNYKVRIFLDGKEIASVKADGTGNFEYTYKELIRPGNHKLYAVATNADGIDSPNSETVSFQLDTKAYIIFGRTIPAAYIFISFLVILVLFLILIFVILFKFAHFRRKLKNILKELEEKVEKDLESEKVNKKAKDKVEKEFEEAEEEVE